MTEQVRATVAVASALPDEVADGADLDGTSCGRVVGWLLPARDVHSLRDASADVATTVDPDDDLLSTGATWGIG